MMWKLSNKTLFLRKPYSHKRKYSVREKKKYCVRANITVVKVLGIETIFFLVDNYAFCSQVKSFEESVNIFCYSAEENKL